MKRLFFGLEPTVETRQHCTSILQGITETRNQAVPLANLHVTLVFLGLLDTVIEHALLEEAATIVGKPFTLHFDHLSYWQKPGVLCLTTNDVVPELLALVGQLSALAHKYAVPLDERAYQAHVTIARKAKQVVEFTFAPIVWQADAFCLFESCSTESGVEYRVLERWKLHQASR